MPRYNVSDLFFNLLWSVFVKTKKNRLYKRENGECCDLWGVAFGKCNTLVQKGQQISDNFNDVHGGCRACLESRPCFVSNIVDPTCLFGFDMIPKSYIIICSQYKRVYTYDTHKAITLTNQVSTKHFRWQTLYLILLILTILGLHVCVIYWVLVLSIGY